MFCLVVNQLLTAILRSQRHQDYFVLPLLRLVAVDQWPQLHYATLVVFFMKVPTLNLVLDLRVCEKTDFKDMTARQAKETTELALAHPFFLASDSIILAAADAHNVQRESLILLKVEFIVLLYFQFKVISKLEQAFSWKFPSVALQQFAHNIVEH